MKPWIIDAATDTVTTEDLTQFTPITNREIRTFLSHTNRNKTVLVAPKGYGKSLLLKKKSADVRKQHQGDPNYLIHPSNASRIVELLRMDGLAQKITDWEWLKRMKGHKDWGEIWYLAIGMLVCHNEGRKKNASPRARQAAEKILQLFLDQSNGRSDIDVAVKEISKESRGKKIKKANADVNPEAGFTTVCQFFTSMVNNWGGAGATEYQVFFNKVVSPILHNLTAVHILFLDSPDQALNWTYESDNSSSNAQDDDLWAEMPQEWINFNLGLLEATHRIREQYGQTITVYTAIRSEAKNVAAADMGMQYEDHLLALKYDANELRQIFFQNIELMHKDPDEKSKLVNGTDRLSDNLLADFIGITHARHEPTQSLEDIFEAICRHTRYTPRDLMYLGGKLADLDVEKRRQSTEELLPEIRTVIDSASRYFLEHHKNSSIPKWRSPVDNFLKNFKTNLIHHSALRFFSPEKNRALSNGCAFDYLYSQGLFGWVGSSVAGQPIQINFLDGDKISAKSEQLPTARWYAFHPVFYGSLRNTHGDNYQSSKWAVVKKTGLF